jgi:hypothetical protein
MTISTKIVISEDEYTKLITLLNDLSVNLNHSEKELLNKIKTSIIAGWNSALEWDKAYIKVKEILAEQTFNSSYRNNSDSIKNNTLLKSDLNFENDRRQGILKELLNDYIHQENGERLITNAEVIRPKTVSDLVDLIISKL